MLNIQFNLEDITSIIKGKSVRLKVDKFNKILNVIAKSILKNGTDKNGYTEISSLTFKKAYTGYKIYLDYARSHNLIERDYYINGKKNFGYRFTEYFKEKISISKITYYPEKSHRKRKKNNAVIELDIPDLVKNRLKSDYKSCNVIYNLKHQQLIKTKDEWGNFIDIGKWLDNNIKLYKWEEGRTYFRWSNGRLYTNFTNLSSHIRLNNIQLNNEPLVEFDIRNSFPLMLAKYCILTTPEIVEDFDFQDYCNSVVTGKFYNELQFKLNTIRNCTKKGDEDDYDTRLLSKSETKLLFQKYLNGDYRRIGYIHGVQSDISKFIEYKYPPIHTIIKQLKDNGIKVYDKLVQIETQLIIDIITELYNRIEEIKILTCHDAIYIPESYEKQTQEIWDKHIQLFTDEFLRNKLFDEELALDKELFEKLDVLDDDWDF